MRLFMPPRRDREGPVVIARPGATRRYGRHRTSALIDGRRVWFESLDMPLETAPEAFGAACLVAAMHAGRPLVLQSPVDTTWLANLRGLEREFRRLWYPEAPAAMALPVERATARAAGTALCFSGGVDAFHALLTTGRPIDTLIGLAGFDVKLRDRGRVAAVDTLVRTVAAAAGARAVSTAVRAAVRRRPPALAGRAPRGGAAPPATPRSPRRPRGRPHPPPRGPPRRPARPGQRGRSDPAPAGPGIPPRRLAPGIRPLTRPATVIESCRPRDSPCRTEPRVTRPSGAGSRSGR